MAVIIEAIVAKAEPDLKLGHYPSSPVPVTKPAIRDLKSKKADPGSKQSRVITMLQSPTGHSVRGFLAGVVRLKLKLNSKKVDGNRVYQIASGVSSKHGSQPKRQST